MKSHAVTSKVPAVTLGFWIVKILATTLGETGGDTLSMTLNLGYLVSSAIFAAALIFFVVLQIRAGKFHPALSGPRSSPRLPRARRSRISPTGPWASDTREARPYFYSAYSRALPHGIGQRGRYRWIPSTHPGSKLSIGRRLPFPRRWAPRSGTGWPTIRGWVTGGAIVFGIALAIIAGLYLGTRISRTFLFWAAFILSNRWVRRSEIFSTNR